MATKHNTKLIDTLGKFVHDQYEIAYDARQKDGHLERMNECLALLRGEDIAAECGETGEDGPTVTINLTRPIWRGVVALMKKPLANAKDRPWELRPTPTPHLSEDAAAQVKEQLLKSAEEIMTITAGDSGEQKKLVEKVVEAAQLQEQKAAQKAASRMTLVVSDKLSEAGWRDAFMTFLRDLASYPFAVMKVEAQLRPIRRWNGSTVTVANEVVKTLTNVSPFDFYPMPGSKSVEDGDGCIERKRLSRIDLYKLRKVAGYSQEAIDLLLAERPNGVAEPVNRGGASEDGDEDDGTSNMYDLLGYFGWVRGDVLEDSGVKDIDESQLYEAEVWACGGYCIRADIKDDVTYTRPFYKTSFESTSNEFYGECPVTDVRSVQLIINAIVRALIRNMSYASGPIGEVEEDRVTGDDDPTVLIPGSVRMVKKDRLHGNPAYRFIKIESLSAELMGLLRQFAEYAYEVLGIPRVAFGSPTGIGAVGRTSGGVAMLLNQSTNTIYDALENVERDIIQPIVRRFVEEELKNNPDPEIKGDLNVFPVGLSGLVEKEARGDKLEWALQSLGPFLQAQKPDGSPFIPPEAPLRLLYKLFKDAGIPTDGIFDDYDLQSAIAENIPSMPGPSEAAASLDGRSTAAMGAIAQQNGAPPQG